MRLSTFRIRSLCAAVLTAMAMLLPLKPALAAEYTDLWVTPGEDAWGVNFVQWGSIIYATFYIYGPDNKPVWYTAVLNYDGTTKYSGTLFSTRGTYFALPWNPADIVDGVPAGTASFQPSSSNSYQGTLIYTVTGVGTINKAVQRLTVASIPLAGTYYGTVSGAYSACTGGTDGVFVDRFPLTVTQTATALTLVIAYEDFGETCTLTGSSVQNGLLHSIPFATYVCTDGLNTTASVFNIKQTAQGIEGQFFASAAYNCREDTRFSAVRN